MSQPTPMTPERLRSQITQLTALLQGRAIDRGLHEWLNQEHGVGSPTYAALQACCDTGIAAGWLCEREHGGIRYGRIFKPSPELHGFSVDVVDMDNIAGPLHTLPEGEIDLVR